MKYSQAFLSSILILLICWIFPSTVRAEDRSILLGLNPINYLEGPEDQDLEEARSLGARLVRIWVQWRKIESEKGHFDWSSLDKVVAFCEQKQMEPWFLVVGAPQHACQGGQLDEIADKLCPPQIEPYRGFLTQLVQRYRGRVRHYEIWSEPDYEHYWITGPEAEEYAELLRASYAVIKKIDSKAQVIMAANNGTNLPFMRGVLDSLSGMAAFDAVASHPYQWSEEKGYTVSPSERHWVSGGPEPVDLKRELLLYKDLLEEYGYRDIPHWITEYGYPAHDDKGGEGYLTLQQQADFLRQTVKLLRDDPALKFVKGFFWFCDRDWSTDPTDPVAKESFGFFGLLWADHKWKPAARVFQELSKKQGETK